jgi:hypothetical protein
MSSQEGFSYNQECNIQSNVIQDNGEFSEYGQSIYFMSGHMGSGHMNSHNVYGGFGFDF